MVSLMLMSILKPTSWLSLMLLMAAAPPPPPEDMCMPALLAAVWFRFRHPCCRHVRQRLLQRGVSKYARADDQAAVQARRPTS